MMTISLPWVDVAMGYLGLEEVPGKGDNGTIVKWLIQLNAWWRNDSTPWCGTFVAHCFQRVDMAIPPAWYRAKSWANWGSALAAPVYGCVVVFERKGGGHVGIVVGHDKRGRLMVLGGNQGDAVSIAPFLKDRVIAYRWPSGYPLTDITLPLIDNSAASSTNEA